MDELIITHVTKDQGITITKVYRYEFTNPQDVAKVLVTARYRAEEGGQMYNKETK